MKRVLTFNHHESYLCLLKDLGWQVDVITKKGPLDLSWKPSARPMPEQFRAISFEQGTTGLSKGAYDFSIIHTVKNMLWLQAYRDTPSVFVAHVLLLQNTVTESLRATSKRLATRLWSMQSPDKRRIVYISPTKQASWGLPGTMIESIPGEVPALSKQARDFTPVFIGNQLAKRGEEVGYPTLMKLHARCPITIIGNNPDIPDAKTPGSAQEFFHHLSLGHVCLYLTAPGYNDGYNLGMLEAMKMGMPIISLPNPSSPIKHGVNGLIGRDIGELEQHLIYLRDHPEARQRMGEAAQKTIKEQFSRPRFEKAWQAVTTFP